MARGLSKGGGALTHRKAFAITLAVVVVVAAFLGLCMALDVTEYWAAGIVCFGGLGLIAAGATKRVAPPEIEVPAA